MDTIDWWPWWVTTGVAALVVLAAVVAFSRTPSLRSRYVLAAIVGAALAAGLAAPVVMRGDDDEPAMAGGAGAGEASGETLFSPDRGGVQAIEWRPLEGVPEGMEGAGLYGDPSKPKLYSLRIRLPDDYFMPPHLQPEAEIMTVIRGMLLVGIGEGFDRERVQALPPGGVAILPARRPHYFRAEGETIVQIEGIGPLSLEYVNPEDAP